MGQSGQEKTEQPTAKKRRDARKEGNIWLAYFSGSAYGFLLYMDR